MDRYFISADQLLCDSLLLARQIYSSGFRPSVIVGIWRGGTPVGIAVQEALEYFGLATEHFPARTALYQLMEPGDKVRIYGLDTIVDNCEQEDSLLIVDDVHDTGKSVEAFISSLQRKMRRNTPHAIRVATPYFKPEKNLRGVAPDYYIHATNRWLVFPHELLGMTPEELDGKQPNVRVWLETPLG